MDYNFWKKTGQIKPFTSVEEFNKYCQDIVSDSSSVPNIKANAALHKSNIKKGYSKGNKYDSFAEFTFCTFTKTWKEKGVTQEEIKLEIDNFLEESEKKLLN